MWTKVKEGAHICNLQGTVNLTSHDLQLPISTLLFSRSNRSRDRNRQPTPVTDPLGSLGSLLSVDTLVTLTSPWPRQPKGGESFPYMNSDTFSQLTPMGRRGGQLCPWKQDCQVKAVPIMVNPRAERTEQEAAVTSKALPPVVTPTKVLQPPKMSPRSRE